MQKCIQEGGGANSPGGRQYDLAKISQKLQN